MVKIRLRRVGAKKQPHYRIVVADSKSPRDGKVIETIGHYNPRTDPPTVEVDQLRALYWLSVGAQPSEAVKRMLDKLQVMARAEAMKRGEVSLEDLMPELEGAEAAPEPEAADDAAALAAIDWVLEGAAESAEQGIDEDWDESEDDSSEGDEDDKEDEDWYESEEEGEEEEFDVDLETDDDDLDDEDDEDWDDEDEEDEGSDD